MDITQILEKESLLDKVIQEVNSSDIKVMIYGCGNSGIQLAKVIRGEQISGFVVSDDNYTKYPAGYLVIDKFPLYSLSALKNTDEKVYLLVSIAPSDLIRTSIENIGKIESVYYLDGQQLLFPRLKYKYVRDNYEQIQFLSSKLKDDYSRELLLAYINTRISGNLEYMEPFVHETRRGIYFDEQIFKREDDEVLVDCGAYNGDTIENFALFTQNSFKYIYAFEPNTENYSILTELQKKYGRIELIRKGCWDKDEVLTFNPERGPMSEISNEGTISIEVDKIDNYVLDRKVTMIKMNIEGSEYKALLGGETTIKKNHPRMAISVYHRPEDLFCIPQLIHEFDNQYEFRLRIYSYGTGLLVLYAE